MTDQQAADLISTLLQAVRSILALLPATSTLQGMDPVMANLIEKLKAPGGGLKTC